MAGTPEWEGLFDFTRPGKQKWEIASIRAAEEAGSLLIPRYARDKALSRDISTKDLRDTIRTGKALEKDLPSSETRNPGISFAKTLRSGRRIKVKVGFLGRRYAVVTAHDF